MNNLLVLGATVALFSATAVVAQEPPEAATIVVQGRGEAERTPDAFFIGGELRGRGADQVTALRALADLQARVSDGLNRLDDLTGARLRADGVTVGPAYGPGCDADRDRAGCDIAGYSASLRFQFKGAPASQAGNAVSLAAELGAQNVQTTGTDVDDEAALRAQASRLAFEDAQAQAQTLATASGRRIVRILRVQDANARMSDYEAGEVDEIVVTGSRVRPSVAIPVDQPPVRVQARINVVFEIE